MTEVLVLLCNEPKLMSNTGLQKGSQQMHHEQKCLDAVTFGDQHHSSTIKANCHVIQ
jgi:hypothetical protein